MGRNYEINESENQRETEAIERANRSKKKTQRTQKPNKSFSKDNRYSKRAYTGKRKGGNDASWHTPNDRMLRDVATFSFHTPTGAKRHLTPYSSYVFELDSDNVYTFEEDYPYVPGVMQYDVIPAIGNTTDGSSPINTSAKAYFSFVRNNKSGTAPYQPADLMFITVALANVYSCLNWLTRIYGLSNFYTAMNNYLPSAILFGENVNYRSVIEHKSEFRSALNNLIYQAAQWFIPNKMNIFQYLTYLFNDIYSEGESVKDQVYYNHPVGFYTYVEGEMDDQNNIKPGYLKFKSLDGLDGDVTEAGTNWETLIAYAQSMIDALTEAEIVNIITADIRNAFNDSDFIKLNLVEPDFIKVPLVDRTTMLTFKNAFPLYGGDQLKARLPLSDDSMFDITQTVGVNNSYIISNPTITIPNAKLNLAVLSWALLHGSSRILSVSESEVDAPIIMDITRLTMAADVSFKYSGTNVDSITLTPIFGAGILWRCHYVTKSQNELEGLVRNELPSVVSYGSASAIWNSDIVKEAEIEAFKYHPAIYNVYTSDSTKKMKIQNVCFDYDVVHLMTTEELKNLNRTSLLALYAVPNVAITL